MLFYIIFTFYLYIVVKVNWMTNHFLDLSIIPNKFLVHYSARKYPSIISLQSYSNDTLYILTNYKTSCF